MPDTLVLECVYEQLNSIKNNNPGNKNANKIIETAYIALENESENSGNQECLKKTNELFNEVYIKFMPSCDEGLENLMECSQSQVSKILHNVF
jgi:hypothetical protein